MSAILEARDAIGGTWDLFRYPGIRSDSDMFTLGYGFRPWNRAESIADGGSILQYIKDTAAEEGIDRRIRFRHRIVAADWSSDEQRWTVFLQESGIAPADFADRMARARLGGLANLPVIVQVASQEESDRVRQWLGETSGVTVQIGYHDQKGVELDLSQRVRDAIAGPSKVAGPEEAALAERFCHRALLQPLAAGFTSGRQGLVDLEYSTETPGGSEPAATTSTNSVANSLPRGLPDWPWSTPVSPTNGRMS